MWYPILKLVLGQILLGLPGRFLFLFFFLLLCSFFFSFFHLFSPVYFFLFFLPCFFFFFFLFRVCSKICCPQLPHDFKQHFFSENQFFEPSVSGGCSFEASPFFFLLFVSCFCFLFFIFSFSPFFLVSFLLLFYFLSFLFPDSAISPPILISCSSHTEAFNVLGTTNGATSHCCLHAH